LCGGSPRTVADRRPAAVEPADRVRRPFIRRSGLTLPGTHKLKTVVNLIVGQHALRIEAFVMRQPDENREQLWSWLLRRNARMYGVDQAGVGLARQAGVGLARQAW
jgi:hypothetical protein